MNAQSALPFDYLQSEEVLMSRAFVKDADETFDELPDRPISPHPNLVTPEGLAAIEAALTRLQRERAHVQASNDRAALATLSRELRYWTSRRASAQVVARPTNPTKVEFGCSITILRADGRKQTYRIVGEDEADPARGTISYVSPVARALLGKEVGETVRVGQSEIELVAIA
jgi:transcription elongation GreA/GreB family factor